MILFLLKREIGNKMLLEDLQTKWGLSEKMVDYIVKIPNLSSLNMNGDLDRHKRALGELGNFDQYHGALDYLNWIIKNEI